MTYSSKRLQTETKRQTDNVDVNSTRVLVYEQRWKNHVHTHTHIRMHARQFNEKLCCKEAWDHHVHWSELLSYLISGVTIFVVAVPEVLLFRCFLLSVCLSKRLCLCVCWSVCVKGIDEDMGYISSVTCFPIWIQMSPVH